MNSSITLTNNGCIPTSFANDNDFSINFENIAKLNIGGETSPIIKSPKAIKISQPRKITKKLNLFQPKEKPEIKDEKIDYNQLDSVFNAFLKSSKKNRQNNKHASDIIDIKNFLITNPLVINNKPELMQTKLLLGNKTKRTKKFIVSNDVPNQTVNSLKNTINFGSTIATFKPSIDKTISIIRIQKEDEENQDINNCNTQTSSNNPGTDMINHKFITNIKNLLLELNSKYHTVHLKKEKKITFALNKIVYSIKINTQTSKIFSLYKGIGCKGNTYLNENEITKELIDIRSNLENEVTHQIKL